MARRFGLMIALLMTMLMILLAVPHATRAAVPGAARRWLADPVRLTLQSPDSNQQVEDEIGGIAVIDGATAYAAARSGILRLEGTRWVPAATFEGVIFRAIAFAGPNNGWAVGTRRIDDNTYMAAARYDGSRWSLVQEFGQIGVLENVAVFADGTAWATGTAYHPRDTGSMPFYHIFRFDGAHWANANTIDKGRVRGLSMVSADEGWATGTRVVYDGNDYHQNPIVLHLKDGAWSDQALPDLGGAGALSISQVAMKDRGEGWAITSDDIFVQHGGRLLRYDNGAWQLAPDPLPGSGCASRAIGIIPGAARGWLSLDGCSDGRERRARMDGGSFTLDEGGAQVAPNVYALFDEQVQWGAHGGMIMRYSDETLPTAPVAATGGRYFPETGHAISGDFKAYYESHGLDLGDPGVSARESLALFGLPLSERFVEVNPDTGAYLEVQYFERARFEAHPENPNPYKVLLGRFGFTTLLRRGAPPAMPNPAPEPETANCRNFPETEYRLCWPFLGYWDGNGGLPVFGFPITEVDEELSQTDGRIYATVWTERERLEFHAELAGTPYEVLLGLLGAEDLRVRGYLP